MDILYRKRGIMWLTIGEYFREHGADFPMESFKMQLRALKPEHLIGSRPWKYHKEDLDVAYDKMCKTSLCMRKKTMK